MSNIPSLTSKKIIKILEHKGFSLDRVKGSHHVFYNVSTKKRVVVPLHTNDLPFGTAMEILKQAGISKDELLAYLNE